MCSAEHDEQPNHALRALWRNCPSFRLSHVARRDVVPVPRRDSPYFLGQRGCRERSETDQRREEQPSSRNRHSRPSRLDVAECAQAARRRLNLRLLGPEFDVGALSVRLQAPKLRCPSCERHNWRRYLNRARFGKQASPAACGPLNACCTSSYGRSSPTARARIRVSSSSNSQRSMIAWRRHVPRRRRTHERQGPPLAMSARLMPTSSATRAGDPIPREAWRPALGG